MIFLISFQDMGTKTQKPACLFLSKFRILPSGKILLKQERLDTLSWKPVLISVGRLLIFFHTTKFLCGDGLGYNSSIQL